MNSREVVMRVRVTAHYKQPITRLYSFVMVVRLSVIR
jgi:hypothetical protein